MCTTATYYGHGVRTVGRSEYLYSTKSNTYHVKSLQYDNTSRARKPQASSTVERHADATVQVLRIMRQTGSRGFGGGRQNR